jgi:hypothetical protein
MKRISIEEPYTYNRREVWVRAECLVTADTEEYASNYFGAPGHTTITTPEVEIEFLEITDIDTDKPIADPDIDSAVRAYLTRNLEENHD